jgi:hypothetical protein
MTSHADILRRGVQLGGEITGVGGVAEDAVAILVGRMLDGVRRQCVARHAELIGWRSKSDVRGTLDVCDSVANGATHGDSSVDVLPFGLVAVAFETFRGINVGWENNWMLAHVGARRR